MQQILFHYEVKKSNVLSSLTILWQSELNYEPGYEWILLQGNAAVNINIIDSRYSD
jgi:hypothetical protein